MMMKKMMADENKMDLKNQINSKRMEDLDKWRNELKYEKDIISNQMSRCIKRFNPKGLMMRFRIRSRPRRKKW
jgi:hypothetical protein